MARARRITDPRIGITIGSGAQQGSSAPSPRVPTGRMGAVDRDAAERAVAFAAAAPAGSEGAPDRLADERSTIHRITADPPRRPTPTSPHGARPDAPGAPRPAPASTTVASGSPSPGGVAASGSAVPEAPRRPSTTGREARIFTAVDARRVGRRRRGPAARSGYLVALLVVAAAAAVVACILTWRTPPGFDGAPALVAEAPPLAPRPPLVGDVKVTTSPSNATLYLDGERLASPSPYTLERIEAGRDHVLLAQLDGYDDAVVRFSARAGETLPLDIALQRAAPVEPPPLPPLSTEAKPPRRGAGAVARPSVTPPRTTPSRGSSPAQASPAPRSTPGTAPATASPHPSPTARPAARDPAPAPARGGAASAAVAPPSTVAAGEGTLVLATTPWCDVTVDGVAQGPTPLTLRLKAGTHHVELSNAEFSIRRTLTVTLHADETLRKKLDF